MKKKLLVALSVLIAAFSFNGLTRGEEKIKTVKVFYPDGIPALTIAKLVKEKPVIDKGVKMDYELQNTPDALVAKVISGEADMAIVPTNLPALAYNKGLPYKLAATSGWGSLFIVSNDELKSISALKGKELYNIGQGLTPDIVTNYILSKNGVNPKKDLTVTYMNSATELAPAFIAGKSKIAVMPEPMLSNVLAKKKDAKIYFDLNKEWSKITGSKNGYPQSCLIIKKDLLQKNKSFVNAFLKKYKEGIEWGNKNPEKLGDYAEALKLSTSKVIVTKTITRANIKYVDIKDCKKDYEDYYKVLFDNAPKSIGGKLPDDGLFMEK